VRPAAPAARRALLAPALSLHLSAHAGQLAALPAYALHEALLVAVWLAGRELPCRRQGVRLIWALLQLQKSLMRGEAAGVMPSLLLAASAELAAAAAEEGDSKERRETLFTVLSALPMLTAFDIGDAAEWGGAAVLVDIARSERWLPLARQAVDLLIAMVYGGSLPRRRQLIAAGALAACARLMADGVGGGGEGRLPSPASFAVRLLWHLVKDSAELCVAAAPEILPPLAALLRRAGEDGEAADGALQLVVQFLLGAPRPLNRRIAVGGVAHALVALLGGRAKAALAEHAADTLRRICLLDVPNISEGLPAAARPADKEIRRELAALGVLDALAVAMCRRDGDVASSAARLAVSLLSCNELRGEMLDAGCAEAAAGILSDRQLRVDRPWPKGDPRQIASLLLKALARTRDDAMLQRVAASGAPAALVATLACTKCPTLRGDAADAITQLGWDLPGPRQVLAGDAAALRVLSLMLLDRNSSYAGRAATCFSLVLRGEGPTAHGAAVIASGALPRLAALLRSEEARLYDPAALAFVDLIWQGNKARERVAAVVAAGAVAPLAEHLCALRPGPNGEPTLPAAEVTTVMGSLFCGCTAEMLPGVAADVLPHLLSFVTSCGPAGGTYWWKAVQNVAAFAVYLPPPARAELDPPALAQIARACLVALVIGSADAYMAAEATSGILSALCNITRGSPSDRCAGVLSAAGLLPLVVMAMRRALAPGASGEAAASDAKTEAAWGNCAPSCVRIVIDLARHVTRGADMTTPAPDLLPTLLLLAAATGRTDLGPATADNAHRACILLAGGDPERPDAESLRPGARPARPAPPLAPRLPLDRRQTAGPPPHAAATSRRLPPHPPRRQRPRGGPAGRAAG